MVCMWWYLKSIGDDDRDDDDDGDDDDNDGDDGVIDDNADECICLFHDIRSWIHSDGLCQQSP